MTTTDQHKAIDISQDNSLDNSLDFESALLALEAIVAEMESGNLPLAQSIDAYKRGAELLQSCQKSLAAAEQQIHILSGSNQLEAFEPNAE